MQAQKMSDIDKARALLPHLGFDFMDQYKPWVDVGQALHSIDDSLLDEWDRWSQGSPKYEPGECARKWASFRHDDGKGIGFIINAAKRSQEWTNQQIGRVLNGRHPDGEPGGTTGGQAHRGNGKTEIRIKPAPQPQPEETGGKGGWKRVDNPREKFEGLKKAADDPEATEFLEAEYGIEWRMIPEDWRVDNLAGHGPGLIYPAIDLVTNKKTVFKYRSFRRDEKGKRVNQHLSGGKGGGLIRLFNPEYPYEFVLTGGEEKAAAAYAAGYNAISPTVGEGVMPPDLLGFLMNVKPDRLIVVNDADQHGTEATIKQVKALAESDFDDRVLKMVWWPEDKAPGYDLNDLLKEEGTDGVRITLQNAMGRSLWGRLCYPNHRRLDLYSADRLIEKQIDPNRSIVGDFLIQEGAITLMAGPPGIGKSRIIMQLAIDIITRRDAWMGAIPIHKHDLRVLILQTENSDLRMQTDLFGMLKGLPVELINIVKKNLDLYIPTSDMGEIVALDDPRIRAELEETIRASRPDLIITDPYFEFFAGENENDSVAARDTMRYLKGLRRAAGKHAAMLLVHHSRTGRAEAGKARGLDGINYARGSKALVGSCRSQVNIVNGSDSPEDNVIIFTNSKNNDGRMFEPFVVEMDEETRRYELVEDFDFDEWEEEIKEAPSSPRKSGGKMGRPTVATMQELTDLIAEEYEKNGGPMTKAHLAKALQQKFSQATAYRKVKEAEKAGVIQDDGMGLMRIGHNE